MTLVIMTVPVVGPGPSRPTAKPPGDWVSTSVAVAERVVCKVTTASLCSRDALRGAGLVQLSEAER